MSASHVDYDRISATYHQRYSVSSMAETGATIVSLARELHPQRVLEVGCGTGRWLAELLPLAPHVHGLDRSMGMLRQAAGRAALSPLTCGDGCRLPYADASFDMLCCVLALHHFADPAMFVAEARRLLRAPGALAIVGIDPHSGRDRWYVYDCFDGTLETDLRRCPSSGMLVDRLAAAGFDRIEWRVAEVLSDEFIGPDVFGDPFLRRDSSSQLALLTEEAYAAGLQRIQAAISKGEAANTPAHFSVSIPIVMITAWLDREAS